MTEQQLDVKMKILLASKKLFADQGYEGTTVRQICDEADVSLALVSYHFGGKENVFYAVLDTFLPSLSEIQFVSDDPKERLIHFVEHYLSFRMKDTEMSRLIHNEYAMNSPRIAKLRSYIANVWNGLETILEDGKSKDVFHFSSTRVALLLTMGCLVFPRNSFLRDTLCGDQDPEVEREEFVQSTTAFILGGLGVRVDES